MITQRPFNASPNPERGEEPGPMPSYRVVGEAGNLFSRQRGLMPCKLLLLLLTTCWQSAVRSSLFTYESQKVDGRNDGRTDGRTDEQTSVSQSHPHCSSLLRAWPWRVYDSTSVYVPCSTPMYSSPLIPLLLVLFHTKVLKTKRDVKLLQYLLH